MRPSLILHATVLGHLVLFASFAQTKHEIVQSIHWSDTSVAIQRDPFDPDNHSARLAVADVSILKVQVLSQSRARILEFIDQLTPSKAPLSRWKKYRSLQWHVEFSYPPDCIVDSFKVDHAPFRGLSVHRMGVLPFVNISFRNRTLAAEAESYGLSSAEYGHDLFSDGDMGTAGLVYLRAKNYEALFWQNIVLSSMEEIFLIRVQGSSGRSAELESDLELESLLLASTFKFLE